MSVDDELDEELEDEELLELLELLLLLDFKLLNNDDAVLVTAEASTLTDTEALAAELEDDELSSSVAVEE